MTSSVAGPWAWYVWHVTWQASLVAVCILALARLGRRRSVRWAYGLGVIALVKFALLPAWSWAAGLFGWLAPAVEAPIGEGSWWHTLASLPGVRWLMVVHVLGAVAVAGWLLGQLIRLARLTRRCEVVTTGPVVVHLGYMTRKMGMLRSVRLLACREAVEPMAFGVWTPSVIVSADMLRDLPPRQVASVLAHELAHHRRGDLWINWLQMILTIVWWFNPLIWMLNRRLRAMREDCCDDLLLDRHLATDDGYCQALLDVAGRLARVRALQWLPRFAEQLGPLGERITRIMDDETRRRSTWSALRAPALAVMALLILPGLQVCSPTAWRPPGRDTVVATPASKRPAPPADTMAPTSASRPQAVPAVAVRRGPPVPPMPAPSAVTIDLSLPQEIAPHHGPDAAGRPPAAPSAGAPVALSVRDVPPPPAPAVMASDIETRLDVALTSHAASYRGMGVMEALAVDRPLSGTAELVGSPDESSASPGADAPTVDPSDGLGKRPEVPEELAGPSEEPTPAVPAGPALAMAEWEAFGGTPEVIRIDPSSVPDWSDDPFGPGSGSGPFSGPGTPEPSTLAFLALAALPVLRRRRV